MPINYKRYRSFSKPCSGLNYLCDADKQCHIKSPLQEFDGYGHPINRFNYVIINNRLYEDMQVDLKPFYTKEDKAKWNKDAKKWGVDTI